MDFHTKRVLTFEEGCTYMGYKPSYVHKLTSSGVIPHSKPNGKKIFFEREKLEAWLLSNTNTSLAEKQIKAATYVKSHPRL